MGAILSLGLLATGRSFADAVWLGSGSDGNWATLTNWAGPTPGTNSGTIASGTIYGNGTDTATFNNNGSGFTTVTVDPNRQVSRLVFDTSSASYTIGSAGPNGGNALALFNGNTITLASTLSGSNITETINAPIVLIPFAAANTGNFTFTNNSTNPTDILNIGGSISVGSTTTVGVPLYLQGAAGSGLNVISGSIGNGLAPSLTLYIGSGGVGASGTGSWELSSANSTFTGGVHIGNNSNGNGSYANLPVLAIGASSTGPAGAPTSGPLGTGTVFLNGGIVEAVGGSQTVANNFLISFDDGGGNYATTFGGTNNLTITGTIINTAHWFTITTTNTALTTLAGGILTTNNFYGFDGTGNIKVTGPITTSGQPLDYAGTGKLIISGSQVYNQPTNVFSGTVVLDGTSIANSSIGSGVVTVSTGAAFANSGTGTGGYNPAVWWTSNNATLQITGNFLIGNNGTASLVVNGGNGTTTAQGTLSTVDGAINTLTINSTAAGANVLTLGNNSILNMEVGATADQIVLGAGLKATANSTVLVNLTGLGKLTGLTQNLIITGNTGAFTVGAGNNFVLNTTSGNFGGYTLTLTGNSTTGNLSVTETGLVATPTTAFWSGTVSSNWNDFVNGNANNTNWLSAATGGTDTHQVPGATTNVVFTETTGATNLNTALGANTTINSLEFNSNSTAVSIGGTNTLTITPSGTNFEGLSGVGLTVNAGAPSETISSTVALGAAQTWIVNNSKAAPLKVTGPITGAGGSNLTLTGTGSTIFSGANTYTGSTIVNNGTLLVNGSLNAGSAVLVSGTSGGAVAILGGTGTIGGAVTIGGGLGTNEVTGGDIGTVGTLTFGNGLTINSGGIAYFDNGDLLALTGGALIANNGSIVQVSNALTTGTYNLITGATGVNVGNISLQYLGGGAAASNFTLQLNGGTLQLVVATASVAQPTLTLGNARVMQSQSGTLNGVLGNSAGAVTLNGTLSNNGGALAISSFSPSGTISVASGTTANYSATVGNVGTSLGAQTVSAKVTDGNASPSTATATGTINVLQNRVVTATTVNLGVIHAGTNSANTTLSTTGGDDQNTRVTVANGGTDSGNNGLAISGGNPSGTFNSASSTDTRTLGGNITNLGLLSGTVTLTTTGEGLTGETPVPVGVGYTAQVFSGTAGWNSGVSGAWATNSNWLDLHSVAIGAPGLSGALSANDTATFGNVTGSPSAITVSLNGVSPTLAGMTFNSTSTTYTIAPGTGGSIILNGASVPINVSTALSPTISAVLSGTGLNKTGTGTLILSGTETYTGSTTISNGAIQTTAAGILPSTTVLLLGDGTNGGQLILGTGATAGNQTVAGLSSFITGSNSVVGGASVISTLTYGGTTGSSIFFGNLGGAGTNQNNLALNKNGASTLVLSGSNTYTGSTILTSGTLGLGSANALSASTTVLFAGGALQYSASNTTDVSNRLAVSNGGSYFIDTNGQTVTFNTALGNLNGTNGLTKSGSGRLVLAATETYTGQTQIIGGVLQVNDLLPNSFLNLNNNGNTQPYSVLQIVSGTAGSLFTRTLAGGGNGTQMNWAGGGGFAAVGGKLTLTMNGSSTSILVWGSGNFMGPGTNTLVFGSTTSNAQVELTNNINFNTADLFMRSIYVEQGLGGDSALLSGTLSGTSGFAKIGGGTLFISGLNTFAGNSTINNGTVVLLGNASADGLTASTMGTGTTAINIGDNGGAGASTAPVGANLALFVSGGDFTLARNLNIVGTGNAVNSITIGGMSDNAITYSGLITTSQNLRVSQVATTGTHALAITNGLAINNLSTVNFTNAGAVNVSGSVTGNGSIKQTGTGVTTFSGINTYSGSTSVLAGTVKINGQLTASNVFVGGSGASGTPTLGGGIGNANGGVLSSPTGATYQVYTSSPTVGAIGGSVTINGTTGGTVAGVLSPGNSVGTMTVGTLTMNAGSVANIEFNSTTLANDFTQVTTANGLTLNGVGFNLYVEGTTNPFSDLGTYALFGYNGTASVAGLTVLNPVGGKIYAFANDTADGLITLTIATANNSALTITPTPINMGDVLAGGTLGSGTATLTNSGTDGSAAFSTTSTGAVTVSPGQGTLAQGNSQGLTVSGSGAVGGISGSAAVVGTISATDISNPTHAGDAGPVNVTANIYDRAIVTTSANGTVLTNSGTGSNGANSLIAAASVQENIINPSNSVTQNFGNWTAATPGPIAVGGSGTVASLDSTGLLNGTYHATTSLKVGNVTNSGGAIAGATQGDVLNNGAYALSATVSGNKSSGVADTYQADILNSYAGYGIGSAAPGTTHTNTGGGGTTVAMIAYGTASNNTSLRMSFDTVPTNADITRASDILTINGADNGINIVGQSSGDGRLLTDVYVLTLSYDLADGGLAYIQQDTSSGWLNAVALNSNTKGSVFNPANDDATFVDDGGVSAKNESFAQYLLNNGGTPTLGDYGYSNGVAWAVLDHTATGDQGLTEFAVVAEVIPEPSTYAMFLGGAVLLFAFRRRKAIVS